MGLRIYLHSKQNNTAKIVFVFVFVFFLVVCLFVFSFFFFLKQELLDVALS